MAQIKQMKNDKRTGEICENLFFRRFEQLVARNYGSQIRQIRQMKNNQRDLRHLRAYYQSSVFGSSSF